MTTTTTTTAAPDTAEAKGVPKAKSTFTIKYIGNKKDFTQFIRPGWSKPVVFTDGKAEVRPILARKLVKAYPKTFHMLDGTPEAPKAEVEV